MAAYRSIEIVTPPDTSAWLEELRDTIYRDEHLRSNEPTAENQVLALYLATALELFEEYTNGRVVLSTTFTEFKPNWGHSCRPLQLSKAKVTNVESVAYYDLDDTLQTVDPYSYGVDLSGTPALLWMLDGEAFPSLNPYRPRPVAITYTAGWDAEQVPVQIPASVKTGIFLLATHLYQYRGDEDVALPDGFNRLCNLWHTGNVPA
jgi:uncharacterized phiE125 gp8 family phage protein